MEFVDLIVLDSDSDISVDIESYSSGEKSPLTKKFRDENPILPDIESYSNEEKSPTIKKIRNENPPEILAPPVEVIQPRYDRCKLCNQVKKLVFFYLSFGCHY